MAYYKCGSIYTTQNSNIVVDTASGAVANFQTPLALPLKSLRIDVNAKQDLHGQSGPYPAGGSAQKWDEEWELGSYNVSGEPSPSISMIRTKNFIPCEPDTTYYSKVPSGTAMVVFMYDSNHEYISDTTKTNQTFTTPNNARYLRFRMSTQYGTTYKNDISINYPATDTAYHPYSNICPIDGVNEINIFHCHKNLYQYDESKVAIGTTTTATTRAYYPLGFKGVTSLTFSASLKSGSSTTASDYLNIGILRKSDGLLEILSAFITPAGITTRTLSISSDDEVVLMSLENPTVIKSILSRYDIQIEVGSQATTYEPYNGSTTLINLGGTYYGGYFTQDKDGHRQFEVTSRIASYTGESGEAWSMFTVAQGNMFRIQASDRKDGHVTESNCKCNSYRPITQAQRTNGTVSGAGLQLDFINNDFSSVEDWKTNLEDNPIQIAYELATPFTIDLSDGEPIITLNGTNNIYADTGDMSLQFRKIG